jgi:adenylosuccinate synthase
MKKTGKSSVGVGLQYGDEGKIKIFDKVFENADVWVRFNGGPNAGHNLESGDVHIVTHGIPSGIFHQHSLLYIGSGSIINPDKINLEIREILDLGVSLEDRLSISSNVSLIQPHHILLDGLKGKEVGTTGNGIGPCYADQAQRQLGSRLKNIRLGDYLANSSKMLSHVEENLQDVIEKHKLSEIKQKPLIKKFAQETNKLSRYLCEDPLFLEKLIHNGKNIFFEGANAVMLDVIKGDVPYVTSSRTLAAAAYTGGDLSVKYHDKTIGVAKAIMSRVGNGPFIAEFGGGRSETHCKAGGGYKFIKSEEDKLYDAKELLKSDDPFHIGIGLRMLGKEYGATTKRPRRIGMLDLVMLRQNCLINGVDEIYINKFDCLNQYSRSSLPGIPLVVAYELDGQKINHMPSTVSESRRATPIVEQAEHIKEDISSIREYQNLPRQVKKLIERIEHEIKTPIHGIGVGPKRSEYIPTSPLVR